MIAEVLIWVLLYVQPGQLPVYISVWQTYKACDTKAKSLIEYFNAQNHPEYELYCVREALRDTVKDGS